MCFSIFLSSPRAVSIYTPFIEITNNDHRHTKICFEISNSRLHKADVNMLYALHE